VHNSLTENEYLVKAKMQHTQIPRPARVRSGVSGSSSATGAPRNQRAISQHLHLRHGGPHCDAVWRQCWLCAVCAVGRAGCCVGGGVPCGGKHIISAAALCRHRPAQRRSDELGDGCRAYHGRFGGKRRTKHLAEGRVGS